ncbi:MAG: alpha/beta fold hydrolase [Candidatus Pacebacteria bacterium]|nr:alpha/beta fold hydrolase [Candidatus Paceibacterota bacterium]
MAIHALFKKKRRRAQVVGYSAISTGLIGFALPLMPGFVLCIVGLSLLSFNSPKIRWLIAYAHAKHPRLALPFAVIEKKLVDFFDLATHTLELIRIPARNEHTLSAILEISSVPRAPLAIVLHAGSSTKESPVTTALTEALRARGYTVLRFDAYDGLGESGGAYPSFTASRYLEDLEDALQWVRMQPWWYGDLLLAGHSVGGTVVVQYAAEHSDAVHRVLLFAPTLSGALLEKAYRQQDATMLLNWQVEGVRPVVHPLTGETHMQSYAFLEDVHQYDCMRVAPQLTMPVEVFCGTCDTITESEACAQFALAIGPNARYVPIPELAHMPAGHHALHTLTRTLVDV